MKITLTDLELFLDELRHRPPNVEPVVRVRATSELKYSVTFHQLLATYVRQYGERIGTVELRYRTADWWQTHSFGLLRESEEETAARIEKTNRAYEQFAEQRQRRYDEAHARIAAVAAEIGVAVAGGEVAA